MLRYICLEITKTNKMKIVAFAGSNSSKSINHNLLQALVPEFSNEVELLSLRDFEAPLYGVDLMGEIGIPDSMKQLHEKMKSADAFVVSVAEHNGSIAAVLKNTYDWLSMLDQKFFFDKPTVFLSTSPGPRGGQSALKHMVEIMPYRGANIVGSYSLGSFSDNYDNGKLSESALAELRPIIATLESTEKI